MNETPGRAPERRLDAALGAVRGDALLEGLDAGAIAAPRLRALAAIRAGQAHPEPGWTAWLRPAWGWATGLAALALLAVTSLPMGTGVPVAAADVSLVTLASKDGVRLEWDGGEAAYLVMRSARPASFEGAQVTLVCGTSWVDRAAGPGAVFYRVVPVRDRCRV